MAFHEELRNHRLKKGLILEEISEETKINVRILQALEQGDFHILPIPYVRIFMKAYAQAIDYPVEDILRGLENELQLTGEQQVEMPLQPPSELALSNPDPEAGVGKFLGDKQTQNTTIRLLGGLAIVILVIVIGKGLLQPPAHEATTAPLLPAINLGQALDSLLIAAPDSSNPRLEIRAAGFLSLITTMGNGTPDTVFLEGDHSQQFVLADSQRIACYPSESALLILGEDTLPATPFTNSWIFIDQGTTGTSVRTYSAY